MWTRRTFIASAGAAFAAGLAPQRAEALASADIVYATAGMTHNGRFAAAIVSETGAIISTVSLPDRGHDVTQCAYTGRLVAFARRPGTFAVVFSREGQGIATITSPEGRHFFGHGAFAPDGKLLYATENDFDKSRGMIGIYDATDGFRRIGEFYSGGVGPHDVEISPDGKWLCIANGGIETHPDYGRAKLNIATMQPNITWLDRDTGTIIATHELPAEYHQLSLRHTAIGINGRIWIGGQYQGARADDIPLIASASPDEPLEIATLPGDLNARLAGYVGAMAASPDGSLIVATSPVGGAAVILDATSGKAELVEADKVCGVSWARDAFVFSTGAGEFVSGDTRTFAPDYYFDHHMVTLTRA